MQASDAAHWLRAQRQTWEPKLGLMHALHSAANVALCQEEGRKEGSGEGMEGQKDLNPG